MGKSPEQEEYRDDAGLTDASKREESKAENEDEVQVLLRDIGSAGSIHELREMIMPNLEVVRLACRRAEGIRSYSVRWNDPNLGLQLENAFAMLDNLTANFENDKAIGMFNVESEKGKASAFFSQIDICVFPELLERAKKLFEDALEKAESS